MSECARPALELDAPVDRDDREPLDVPVDVPLDVPPLMPLELVPLALVPVLLVPAPDMFELPLELPFELPVVLDDPFALGCDSSTSPPEEPVVVLRCMDALPVAGMQFVELPVVLDAPIEPVVVLPLVAPGEPMVPVVPTPALADVPVPVAPVVLLPIVAEALVPEALVPVAPVPVVPVVPVAAPLAVPPNVALMPVPESVRPVAPVALVIPGAGADRPMLPLLLAICPGGQGDMLLLLVAEPDVVCCAPTEPAMAAPSTSDMLMARHRTRWSDPVCEVDIIPSVSLPLAPPRAVHGRGAPEPASSAASRSRPARRLSSRVDRHGAQCACLWPAAALLNSSSPSTRPGFRMHV